MDSRMHDMRRIGKNIPVRRFHTIIVGAGCAGLNAADSLFSLGQKDIAVIAENSKFGTSRNTGSDKQTYYKLTLAGGEPDSVRDMAKSLFDGGAMHGDIALIEAALSARCFNKLVELGVPFPCNEFGEYVGYKTDHDPKQRATSAGPLTSKYMTEALEKSVRAKNIPILEPFLVISVLTDEKNEKESRELCSRKSAIGVLALNTNELANGFFGFTVFLAENIVYATGGPAGMYRTSVYPKSQTGALGIAFEAGAKGVNLTESQYGIASLKFRWNLSGTYQQVIPRYISTDAEGNDEREFLLPHFPSAAKMMQSVFLKGYQWPFDPRKIDDYGSSLIDMLVYQETEINKRRVFLDFRVNPMEQPIDFDSLDSEVSQYLKNCGADFGTPIERLAHVNPLAIELYRNNGIDLNKERLEIAVCAQHTNGGLVGDCNWESNLKRFYPVGECNGSFGVYRPGGSALNSTQVGSLRAAQHIVKNERREICTKTLEQQIEKRIRGISLEAGGVRKDDVAIDAMLKNAQIRMTQHGAHIRSLPSVVTAIEECRSDWRLLSSMGVSNVSELPSLFRLRDVLISQFAFLSTIKEYLDKGGSSRGSYFVPDVKSTVSLTDCVCEIQLFVTETELSANCEWKSVRPIPESDYWFENVWRKFRNRLVR